MSVVRLHDKEKEVLIAYYQKYAQRSSKNKKSWFG